MVSTTSNGPLRALWLGLVLLSSTHTPACAKRKNNDIGVVFPTALHNVSKAGKVKAVIQLLKLKPEDLSSRDAYGKTPLMAAAKHAEVTKVLLEAGANVTVKSKDGLTALHWAAKFGEADVIRALVQGGAVLEAKDIKGYTAVYTAVSSSKLDAIYALAAAGANLNARSGSHGWTALHSASQWGRVKTITALLKAGADPDLKNRQNGNAVYYALDKGCKECAEAITAAATDPVAVEARVRHESKQEELAKERQAKMDALLHARETAHKSMQDALQEKKDTFKQRVVAYYTQVSPTDLHKVDVLATKYLYNQENLFRLLHEKYSVPVAGAAGATPAKDEL